MKTTGIARPATHASAEHAHSGAHNGSHHASHHASQNGKHNGTHRSTDRLVEPRRPGMRASLAAHAKFLAEFITSPGRMGAVAASSPALAKRVADQIDFARTSSIVEFGAGTGVITKELLARLRPEAKFFAIEFSPELAAICRRNVPGAKLFQDSAENVVELCRSQGIQQLDVIVSGLPWASFPESLQDRILEASMKVLRPGGKLVLFGYQMGLLTPAGRRFHSRLPRYFESVSRSRSVWMNLPPALVFTCVRADARTTTATSA